MLTEKIIDRFLDETLAVIREQPERLTEIDGIGEKKAAAIHAQWQAHHLLADVMQFLSENGISTAHSGKIVSLYGPDALAMIRQDPYQLANDIPGMDFATADRIARNLGLKINLYDRAQACILHILRSAASQGHVFVNEKTIVDQVGAMDDMDFQTVQDSLEDLAAGGDIQFSISADPDALGRAVYLDSLWQAEQTIAAGCWQCLPLPRRPAVRPWIRCWRKWKISSSSLCLPSSEKCLKILSPAGSASLPAVPAPAKPP